jgi:hypothetical protein
MKLILISAIALTATFPVYAQSQPKEAWIILKRGCDTNLGYCGYVDKTTGVGDITSKKPESKWSKDFPEQVTYGASQFS